jgi:peptide/nickel transport system substrate-binding protein
MVLNAQPGYWRGDPFFKQVVLKIVPNESDRVLLLQQGTVDIAEGLGIDSISALQGSDGVQVLSIPTRNQVIMGLNNHIAPFDNKLVRQAMSYAVPYDEIATDIYKGQAVENSGPIPVGGRYYDASLWPYSFDQAKAKSLLEQAGLGNGFRFTVHIPTGNATLEQLTVLLQTRLKEIGIDMQIQPDEPAVFAQGLDARSHPAWIRDDMIWYVDDPGYTGQFMFKNSGCCDWQDYNNPQVDNLIDQMISLFNSGPDLATKTELAAEYQTILIDEAPQVYLAQTNFLLAMRSDITGYEQGPDNLLKYFTLQRQAGG